MPITLITGPHQSGKSRRLWERLRAEPPGAAVLVRPVAGLPAELVRQVHAWTGPGLIPPVWSLAELVERCAAGAGELMGTASDGLLTHLLRGWARRGLRGPWASLAEFRATGRELAELCRRLDDHDVGAAELATAARAMASREPRLAAVAQDIAAARGHVDGLLARRTLMLPGARLRALAAGGGAPAVAGIYIDDFQAFSPGELALLRALGERRTLVIAAVDDARLGADASPAARLRAALPGASEERLGGVHPRAPHAPGARTLLAGALAEGHRVDAQAAGCYRYRDAAHAGRAIAAWLRRAGVAPAQATLVVRAADAEALALADALRAAEVPISGTFQVPLLGTAAGGRLAALATFCRSGDWAAFLDLVERLDAEAPPLRLPDLRGPWARLPVDAALAQIAALADQGVAAGWGWQEPDRARPWLTATLAWLRAWRKKLGKGGHAAEPGADVRAGAGSAWWDGFAAQARALDLDDGGSGALATLAEWSALQPVGAEDLDELLAAARVPVVRDGGPGALVVSDAVRGRIWPRAVVLLHGLEHGRWPAQAAGGALLPADERRALAAALGRDVYDDAGRAAGEVGALLAAMGRATARVVLGIPCGEREPCAWLGTLADQLGWQLEDLRAAAGDEAVPGAPLGPGDSQGAHERALWGSAPGSPSFTFRVPPCAPQLLGLKASALGSVYRDGFALVCDRLALGEPLSDLERRDEGNALHQLLARLAPHPAASWPHVLGELLRVWVADAPDALVAGERARLARRVTATMAGESASAADALSHEAEVRVDIRIPVPGHEPLALRGSIDRLDTQPDGTVRLVDYKRGSLTALRSALDEERDGQLLAYLLGAEAKGLAPASAYYLGLGDGRRAGWGGVPTLKKGLPVLTDGVPLAELERLAGGLGSAIAALAAGTAHADPDGRSASEYAPLARLDEQRLDQGGGDLDAAEGGGDG